jgi:hypothetical protein
MRLIWQAVVFVSLLALPVWSDILYSNGAIRGGNGGSAADISEANVNYGYFDAFSLSSDSTVTGISNIGLWVFLGRSPLSLS